MTSTSGGGRKEDMITFYTTMLFRHVNVDVKGHSSTSSGYSQLSSLNSQGSIARDVVRTFYGVELFPGRYRITDDTSSSPSTPPQKPLIQNLLSNVLLSIGRFLGKRSGLNWETLPTYNNEDDNDRLFYCQGMNLVWYVTKS